MKKAIRFLLIAAGAYLGLMLLTGLIIKYTLAGSLIDRFTQAASGRSPVPVEISGGDFSILQWLRFRPAITLRDLRVGNPEGYSSEPMLTADSLDVQVGLLSLLSDQVRILAVVLREPSLTIEANREGRTNIQAVFDQFSPAAGAQPAQKPSSEGGRSVSVDSLQIQSGVVRYSGPNTPPFVVRDLNVEMSNVSLDTAFDVHVDASLLGSDASRLRFDGRGGPRSKSSLPARGELLVELAPGDIPAEIRTEYFGSFLGDPGSSSSISLEASMNGDLLAEFSGDGRIVFTDLSIGRDSNHWLPLAGEAPLQIDTQSLLGNPRAFLVSDGASLTLGAGQWQGSLRLGYSDAAFQAASDGSVTGVRIEELLGAFTGIENAVSGLAEIPNYALRSTGANAEQLRDALTGSGSIHLTEGRVALFDLAGTIERNARKLLTGEAPAEGETSFLRFDTNFGIADRRLSLSDLSLAGESLAVSGRGFVTFDKALDFDLDASVRGQVAGLLGARPDESGVPAATLPVKITGTLESPRVRPDLGKVAARKALGFLESLLPPDK